VKPITIDNVTYKSLAAAWRAISAEGVSFALARKRIQRGWLAKRAFVTPPIPPQLRRTNVTNSFPTG
jgi:hypothetical protein